MPHLSTVAFVIVVLLILFEAVRIGIHARKAVAAGKRAVPVSKTHTNPHKRVLVIGDSTSFGTGSQESKNSLVGRLAQDFDDLEIVNASENAMSIKRLSEKLAGLRGTHFDAIMMHIGGVDTLSLTSSRSILHYFNLIAEATQNLGATTIVLISMNNVGGAPLFRFPLNMFLDWRSKKLSALFSHISEEHGFVHVPLHRDLACCPLVLERDRLFSEDKIHPNDAGYGVWYRIIKDAVTPYLSRF